MIKSFTHIFIVFLFIQFASSFSSFGSTALASSPPELILYAYDSFLAPGGLGEVILPLFERKFGCRVRALATGDGTQLLTRLALDAARGKPAAQLVVGIDQQTWESAKQWVEPWEGWTPAGYENLLATTLLAGKGFLPYDFGVFAFIMDRLRMEELKLKIPQGGVLSIQELLEPQWKRNIILEDPRTSTPGLAFLLYTTQVLKKIGSSGKKTAEEASEVWTFWEKFRGQWLTLTPGWSAAYGLFLKKEAPLVWSYITSQAYHRDRTATGKDALEGGGLSPDPKPPRYQAIMFKEGQPFQIEGAALIRGSFHSKESRQLAQKFLEFLISPEVQKIIPQKAWMMPVLKGTELPRSYRNLPQPFNWVKTQTDPTEMTKLLSRWKEIVGRSF